MSHCSKLFTALFFISMAVFSQNTLVTAEQLLNNKQFAKAEQLMTTYIKGHPNDLKAIELLGDAFGYQKKWDEAIDTYKTLVDASPNTANYHYKYGGALSMKALTVNKLKALGIIGDAKKAFLTAAQLDSKHINARWALVKLYMQLPGLVGGSKKKALLYADELERLSAVDGYLAKGYIYNDNNNLELAEMYYKKAVTTGGSITCYKELITFYIKQDKPKKALEYLKKGYKIHKNDEFLKQIIAMEKQD